MSGNALEVRNKITTLDKIRKYYLKGENSVTLSEKQESIRINIYKAWNLLIHYHSNEQAVNVLKNEGISHAQAYRYVNDAKSIFGDVEKNHQEAEKYLIKEDLMRLQQRAIKDKDGLLELRVINSRIKLAGFDKNKDPKFDPDKLKAQTYVLKLHPSAAKMIEVSRDGNSIDFNNVDTEDIDYQDVNDGED